MNLGGKIRSLRVAKLMTQVELAGNHITRNMLSSIENGKAIPSLSTLQYLAGRLNVPVGFLLAEEGDEVLWRKMNALSNMKRAYRTGDLQDCRALCLSACPEPDDELCMLLAECDLGIAADHFWAGKLHLCAHYFDEAMQYAAQSLYALPHIASMASVYFDYLSRISPTLYSDESFDTGEKFSWNTSFSLYVRALQALEEGNLQPAKDYRKLSDEDSDFFEVHLQLKLKMAEGRYSDAKNGYLKLLEQEEPLFKVNLFEVLRDLEVCCREIEDYKNAYRFSNEKMQLLEQLLAE